MEARLYPAELKPTEFLGTTTRALPTVELNTTGYRLLAEGQFERWAEQTPRVPLRAQAGRLPNLPGRDLRGAGEAARRPVGPIRVLVGSKRDEGVLALLLGLARPVPSPRVRLQARVLGGRRAAAQRGLRRRSRGVRRVLHSASATRPTRRRSSATPPSGSRRSSLRESRCSRTSATRTSRRRPSMRGAWTTWRISPLLGIRRSAGRGTLSLR